jgi:membrane-associated phospholipid phosphatase
MKKIFIFIFIILFVFNIFCIEKKKEDKKEETDKKDEPFFKCIVKDEGHILSSPFRIKGKDLFIWGSVGLITVILIHNDERIYKNIKDYQEKHSWVDDISPKITKLGLGEYNLGIAGAFYLGGLVLKDPRAKETARLVLMTYIHTGVVAQIGKHIFGRQRPSWDNGIDHWAGPSGFFKRYKSGQISHYDAFPSGHMLSIMGTATVVSEMYKHTIYVPIISYTLAGLCGLSRVTEDTHWISDVFISAVLGYAIGKYIVKRRNRLNKLNIIPVAQSNKIGISINYIF